MTARGNGRTRSPLSEARRWTAVLEGHVAADAREAVRDIAAESREAAEEDPSLSRGLAGSALFFAALAEESSSEADAELAADLVGRAVEAVGALSRAAFYDGAAGVAWVVQHLAGRLLEDDGLEELLRAVDESLLDLLNRPVWESEIDLVSGLVGYGVYFLERPPNEVSEEALVRIVAHLDALAEVRGDETTWLTPPRLLPDWQRVAAPEGYYNVGLAHGVPGVVAFLGLAHRAGVDVGRTRRLLDGAVRWLLAQELDSTAHSFPSWVRPGADEREPARLAWCYGHLGLGLALLVAARSVRDGSWEARALSILEAAAERPAEGSGVMDTGLCHGAAGVAHLFNRTYQATGVERLRVAARRWYERTLAMRMPDTGVAGFPSFRIDQGSRAETFEPEPGLLEGAAGVGLALLSAAGPVEPAWDRFMLVS